MTDLYGAFVVTNVAAAEQTLVRVEALGYSAWELEYGSGELPADGLWVLLVNAPIELEGIEVAGRRVGDPLSVGTGTYMMDAELVRAQPVVLETDVLRATVLSPSASASSDWVSVPFIRGGSAEGTPVRLDGVRLFNPFHVGGFVAALNAEAVKSVALVTGSSVGALATGSLSGAIDIATRDGARDRFRTSGSLGLASARLTAEGPVGESMSFLVDGRRTYIDLLTKGLAAVGLAGSRVPYSFGDDVLNLAGEYNSVKLPPYARIDVGWRGSWEVAWFGGGVLSPYASVANLFSLPNVVGVGPERGRTSPGPGNGVSELVYAPQLPMLPFLGVEFRF